MRYMSTQVIQRPDSSYIQRRANMSSAMMTYAYGERKRTAARLSPSTLTVSICPRA